MSSIFLYYRDVRNLVAVIRDLHRPVADDAEVAKAISFALGISADTLMEKLAETPSVHAGVNFTTQAYRALGASLGSTSGASLPNRKRVELVAQAFGWRGDAFMHHLKTTTGHLTPNPSLAPPPHIPAIEQLSKLGFTNIENWMEAIQGANGLCVASGPKQSGKSTLIRLSSGHLRETGSNILSCASFDIPEDDKALARDRLRAAVSGWLKSNKSKRGRALVLPHIRTATDLEFAVQCSKECLTFTEVEGASILHTIESLSMLSRRPNDAIRGIANVHLVPRHQMPGVLPICENAVFRIPIEFAIIASQANVMRIAKKLSLDLDDLFAERQNSVCQWKSARAIAEKLVREGQIDPNLSWLDRV